MKLSKKLLALGLSVGLVVSSIVPVFAYSATSNPAAAEQGMDRFLRYVEKEFCVKDEAERQSLKDLTNRLAAKWSGLNYGGGLLHVTIANDGKAQDLDTYVDLTGNYQNGTNYANANGILTADEAHFNGEEVISLAQFAATDAYDTYVDAVKADFVTYMNAFNLEGTFSTAPKTAGWIFSAYPHNTVISTSDDAMFTVNVYDLIAYWTRESQGVQDIFTSLNKTKICGTTATTTPVDKTKCICKDDCKNGCDKDCKDPACNKVTPTTVDPNTTCTTTTTTTVTTTPVAVVTVPVVTTPVVTSPVVTTPVVTAPAVVRPVGTGLPLANTSTNYGNVMALGLGAMIVALGVFAYSKKITA